MESKVKGAICSLQEDVKNHINILSLTSWNTQLIINLVIKASRIGYLPWNCRVWKMLILAHPPLYLFIWEQNIEVWNASLRERGVEKRSIPLYSQAMATSCWLSNIAFHVDGMKHIFESAMSLCNFLPGWRQRHKWGNNLMILLREDIGNARPLWQVPGWQGAPRGESVSVVFLWWVFEFFFKG